ncbi:hypothetical protein Tco_1308093 [Tanacetum coccineum]
MDDDTIGSTHASSPTMATASPIKSSFVVWQPVGMKPPVFVTHHLVAAIVAASHRRMPAQAAVTVAAANCFARTSDSKAKRFGVGCHPWSSRLARGGAANDEAQPP